MTPLHVSRLDVRSRRLLALFLVAVAGVVTTPATALAHAHLRRSAPAAGSTVSSPSAVRLWFTEAPELALTKVTLLDSTGTAVTTAVPEPDPEGTAGVRVRVERALAPGRYTVRWSTAASDGHPSSGSFTFRVAAPAGAMSSVVPADTTRLGDSGAVAARPAPMPAPTLPEISQDTMSVRPMAVVARGVWFAAVVLVIGAVVLRIFVLPRADVLARDASDATMVRVADRAALACALFLAATVVRLYLQSRMMAGQLQSSAPLRILTMDTRWGLVWRMQLGAGVLALLAFLAARRRLAGAWAVAALAGLLIAVGVALGGHAAAAEQLTAFAVADDALHVAGASGWLGGLFWVVAVGMFPLRDVNDEPARRIASLVSSFSPVALWCAGVVALSGIASAWLRLGSISALSTTPYGRLLLVKVALVAAAGGFGFYNWRRLRPLLGSDLATARLRRSATMELVVGGLIVLVTALLVGLPTPVPGVR
jgi:copper transport protein